ncbi:MAG: D-alanine--D-alanine ligase [Mariprofundaceae bacterium]|nr:D-alanine--D-alanine ligase [Mariprofundaceae bacterium]
MSILAQRIVVLMGGASAERVISLASGQAVLQALQSQGLDVLGLELSEDTQAWQQQIKAAKADVAFITLHGTYGEDGCVQGLLETMQLPYTGSKVTASALCMHKKVTKAVLQAAHIKVAQDAVILDGLPQTYPLFVKPVAEGSSVGLFAVADEAAWLALPMQVNEAWLVEQVVEGVEVAVSVLDGKALPVVEVVPESGVYDFESKYTQGATAYFCPARLPDQVLQQCQNIAEQAVTTLGCVGAPRVDLIVPEDGEPVVLEVNTIPGMTNTSLLPKAAAQVGISFADLCVGMVREAALGGEA